MRQSDRRPHRSRNLGEKLIIACEGQTEKGYFDAIRETLRLSTKQVILRHEGSKPLTVVETAIRNIERLKESREWGLRDTAWAVFDGEEHQSSPGDRQNWNTAIQLAKSKNINLAISNPCFELWYLLHFEDQTAYLNREQARQKLKKYVPDYEKNLQLYPDPLAEKMEDAIERAQKLSERAQTLETDLRCDVYQLIKQLFRLKQ